MSGAASGVAVEDACVQTYLDIKRKRAHKFVLYHIGAQSKQPPRSRSWVGTVASGAFETSRPASFRLSCYAGSPGRVFSGTGGSTRSRGRVSGEQEQGSRLGGWLSFRCCIAGAHPALLCSPVPRADATTMKIVIVHKSSPTVRATAHSHPHSRGSQPCKAQRAAPTARNPVPDAQTRVRRRTDPCAPATHVFASFGARVRIVLPLAATGCRPTPFTTCVELTEAPHVGTGVLRGVHRAAA